MGSCLPGSIRAPTPLDDAKTDLDLIEAVEGDITSVVGDAAHDTVAMHETARARGADVIVPPARRLSSRGEDLDQLLVTERSNA